MQFAKVRSGVVKVDAKAGTAVALDMTRRKEIATLADLLASADPAGIADELATGSPVPLASLEYLAPVDRQEVWAAGVTYKRSKVARQEESKGAAHFYDLVYSAARPELFLKATPERVVGHGAKIRVRADSRWNVPEPELTLVVSPDLRIVGFTVGDDVSSRDIEGENPLYLPQAKVYAGSASVGPFVTLARDMPPLAEVGIKLVIRRGGKVGFEGTTSVSQMARTPEDLVSWLGRENEFPHGVLLMTGTGIVPPDEFSLTSGDVVDITIDGIGTLTNPVA
jgi:2-dehydro-3-deoxy-D-arabinonate dehydratase